MAAQINSEEASDRGERGEETQAEVARARREVDETLAALQAGPDRASRSLGLVDAVAQLRSGSRATSTRSCASARERSPSPRRSCAARTSSSIA
jgi:hypothetical protein